MNSQQPSKEQTRRKSEDKIVSKTNSTYAVMQAKQAAGPYIYTDETIQNQESARIQSYHKNSLAEIKTS